MTRSVAWTLLIASGALDVCWAIAVKKAEGYTRAGWTILSLILLAAFIGALGKALEILPVGVAYAVWTGVGAAGAVAAGVLFFGETITPQKLVCIVLIGAGVAGLKLLDVPA